MSIAGPRKDVNPIDDRRGREIELLGEGVHRKCAIIDCAIELQILILRAGECGIIELQILILRAGELQIRLNGPEHAERE